MKLGIQELCRGGLAVMLAVAPAWAAAQSFADGLRYQPQVDLAPCAAMPECLPAPVLWEGGETQPALVAPAVAAAQAEPADISPVPEPRSIGLMLAGLGLVVLIALRRRAPRPVLPSLRFPL